MRVVTEDHADGQGGPHEAAAFARAEPADDWHRAVALLLEAIDPARRAAVAERLGNWTLGGRGLRDWVRQLQHAAPALPDRLPPPLVQIYLDDADAEPRHDCAECGLAVPVRPGIHREARDGIELEYFPTCPVCGGPTGLYAYWANPARRRAAPSRREYPA